MNVKLKVLTAGVIFFMGGQAVMAQNDSIKTIEEVVVTGYRVKKAEEITQAQSTVSGKELKQQANTVAVTQMLQGKSPGVLVQAQSGQPGATGTINIRGFSNLAGTGALVVIDGQYSSFAALNAMNPSEIETVTTLKDAAATAQYGSKASAGVIVVTTKRGVSGKTSYSFESRFGFSHKISDKELNFEMMDAAQKLRWENELAALGTVGNTGYTAAQVASLTAKNHDWQKDILRNSAEESYLFSANGGSKNNIYYYSLGYDVNTGIVKYLTGLKRYTGRFNFENQLSDKLRIGLNTSGQYQETQNQRDRYNGQNPIYFMYAANPYEDIYLPDGSYNPTSVGFPILEALKTNTGENRNLRLNANVFGEYKITDYLKFRSSFFNTYNHLVTENIIEPKSYLDVILGYNGQISKANNDIYNFTTVQRLDFDKSFGEHKVTATAFYEFYSNNLNTMTATGRNFRTPGLYILANTVTPFTATGGRSQYRTTGLALLADYNYGGRYILSGSIRRDGSSRFGANNLYGIFWSGSAAWNVAKEAFMSGSGFNSLKFRASYGITGNDAAIPDYANVDYASFGVYGNGPTTVIGGTVGNPNIKWEKVAITNFGVDFGYQKDRFKGAVEYFINKRSDFIQQVPQEVEGGSYSTYENVGDLENKGLEAELSADVIRKSDLVWNLRGNITNVQNKVIALSGGQTERIVGGGLNLLKVGEIPFLFRTVKYAGVNSQTGEALYYTTRTTPNPGETFVTLPGGTATNVYSSQDIQAIEGKSPFPKFFGGFGTTVTYKNFDVSADFTYKYGGYMMNYMALNMLDSSQYDSNKRIDAFNYWKNPGDTNVLPKPTSDGLYTTDYFLQKSDYIRFRSLNLGYTFDKNFLGQNVPVNSVRVFAQGMNLFTWTNYEGEPEASIGSGESNTEVPNSYSLYTYPIQKTYSVGIELNF